MTKEEAISYLQQLYPNGGHCWLDEQRIEAIDMAVKTLQEEPVSEDLDIAMGEYCSNPDNFITYIDVSFAYRSEQKDDIPLIIKAIKFGANWQKEQFEKNRLKHCNSITNEQAELEDNFVSSHIKKYNRMPTFLDAIEYGMKLRKQEMIKEAVEIIIKED